MVKFNLKPAEFPAETIQIIDAHEVFSTERRAMMSRLGQKEVLQHLGPVGLSKTKAGGKPLPIRFFWGET